MGDTQQMAVRASKDVSNSALRASCVRLGVGESGASWILQSLLMHCHVDHLRCRSAGMVSQTSSPLTAQARVLSLYRAVAVLLIPSRRKRLAAPWLVLLCDCEWDS